MALWDRFFGKSTTGPDQTDIPEIPDPGMSYDVPPISSEYGSNGFGQINPSSAAQIQANVNAHALLAKTQYINATQSLSASVASFPKEQVPEGLRDGLEFFLKFNKLKVLGTPSLERHQWSTDMVLTVPVEWIKEE